MTVASSDSNLRIALTLLQFVALALPAIYIYLQLVDTMEVAVDIDDSNKYQIARSSVITLIVASILLLVSIGSNIQNSPSVVIINQSTEAGILIVATALTMLGATQFGFSIVVRLIRLNRDEKSIKGAYSKTIRDFFR